MAFSAATALQYLDRARERGQLAHAYIVSGLDTRRRVEFAADWARRLNASAARDLPSMAAEGVVMVEAQMRSRAIGIDQIRSLEHVIRQRAGQGRHKIGVIVEADRMTSQATNAFLKTLEEPPPDSLLLLLTGSPSQLLPTVLSRCLRIALVEPEPAAIALDERGRRLVEALAAHFTKPPAPARALGFVRVYTTLLAEEKEALAKACADEYKLEAEHYDGKTDADAWLRQRQEYFETLAHARYIEARGRALGLVVLWFGDLVRRRTGHPRLAFPQHEAVITQAATLVPVDDWLRRIACLEDLRRSYETNVNETLATEMAFLGALG